MEREVVEKIGIIGIGAMGETILSALVSRGFREICIHDVVRQRTDEAVRKFGVKKTDGIKGFREMDLTVVAVKPKDCRKVFAELGKVLNGGNGVLSIAAGIGIKRMKEWSGREDIYFVRAMPNISARVRESATAVYFDEGIPERVRRLSLRVLRSFGMVYELDDEGLMDAFTALSGSSPAVVWKFLKAIEDAGVLMGIPRQKSMEIGIQVMKGAVKMLEESGCPPEELIKLVTSPGGTTVEALFHLDRAGFNGIVIESLMKACEKAKKLEKS